MKILQPPGWAKPRGYANGIVAHGTWVMVAGQIGWNADGIFESDDFAAQAERALENVVAVLAEAGAAPEDVVRMTWYVTDRDRYLAAAKDIGVAYRRLFGRHFPTMTAVQVVALIEARALVEIEATAVIAN
jgi:enamine deaminase RidA (YjgF/YER057c/UK114 family)